MTVSTAISASQQARAVGIKTSNVNMAVGQAKWLPQRIAVIAQGNTASTYSTTKVAVTSALAVANDKGFGSPAHLIIKQLLPNNGDGVGSIPITLYPLDDSGTGVAAEGDITPTVGSLTQAAYIVRVNNIDSEQFVVEVGDDAAAVITKMIAAVNANLNMPVNATDRTTKLILTSKWKGASANEIKISVIGPTDMGMTWAYTQPNGGLVNPTVDAALAQIGNVWETLIINALEIGDTTALDAYAAFGVGRLVSTVHKRCLVFTGNTLTTVALATAISDARKTDQTNCQLVEPYGEDLPFVVAARQVARIAVMANSVPSHDYTGLSATGLVPGVDGSQWDDIERDAAVKAGSSTIIVDDSVIKLENIMTFYHPTGDELPAYQFVVDNIKLMNVEYNVSSIFNAPVWAGAALVPDAQVIKEPTIKKPKMAKADLAVLTGALAEYGIISDPEYTEAGIVAVINGTNPKRLDISYPIKLSGNTNIISIDLNFGFYFGTAPVIG